MTELQKKLDELNPKMDGRRFENILTSGPDPSGNEGFKETVLKVNKLPREV